MASGLLTRDTTTRWESPDGWWCLLGGPRCAPGDV